MKPKQITETELMKRSITELEFHCKLKTELIEKLDETVEAQKKYIGLLESQNKDLIQELEDLKESTKFIFN